MCKSQKENEQIVSIIAILAWWCGAVVNVFVLISAVVLNPAHLVHGWMTVCRQVNHLSM